jgi:hypothetical protein
LGNTLGVLKFTPGLLPVYRFYIDSYLSLLKSEFWKTPKNARQSKSLAFVTEFLNSLDVLATALVGIAVHQKSVSFLQVADTYNRFLVVGGGEFGDFFREKVFPFVPRFLANFLILARDTGLTTQEHFNMFEQVVGRLARDDRGRHKKFLEAMAGPQHHERSFLFDIYHNSVAPALGERAIRSYEEVAQDLGEFRPEETQLLGRKMEEIERKSIEKHLKSHASPQDIQLTDKDWNYPFSVPGESALLFKVAFFMGHVIDRLRGSRPIPSAQARRMWKYHNGEKMWLSNPMVGAEEIPHTRVRWMAQWLMWVKLLAGFYFLMALLVPFFKGGRHR